MELIKKNLGKVAITCDGKWDINKSYDKLSLVYDNKTNISYISKQDVPIGINIDNITYWQKFQLNNGSSPVEGEGIDNVYLLPFDGVNKSGTLTVKQLDEIKDAIDSNKIIILKYYDKDYESYEYYLYDNIYKNNFDIILKHSYINGNLLTIYDCIIDPLGKTYKLNSNNFNINNIYILPYNLYDHDEKEFNINNDEFNKLQVAISENKLILAKINKNSNSYVIPNISVIEDHININYKSINYTYDGEYYELTIYVETLSCVRNYLDLSFQKELESGKNIKTVNRQSILGGGDVTIVFDLEYVGLPVVIDNTQTISGEKLARLTDAIQKNTIFKCEYNNKILYCNSIQQIDNNININFILNSENNILHKLTLKVYVNAGAYNWRLEPIFEQEEATALDINLSDDIGDVLNYNIIANSYLNKKCALSAKIDSDIVYANSLNCTDNISSLEDMTYETRFIATFLKDNLLYEVTFSFVDEFKSYMKFNVTKLTMLYNTKIIGNEVITIPFTLDNFDSNVYVLTEDNYKFIYDKLKTGCKFLITSSNGHFKESAYVFDNNKINSYDSFYLENDNLRLDFFSEGNVDSKVRYVSISRKFNHTYCIDHVYMTSGALLSAYIYYDLLYMTENNVIPQIIIKDGSSNKWYYSYYLHNDDSQYIELGITLKEGGYKIAKITLVDDNTNIDFINSEK